MWPTFSRSLTFSHFTCAKAKISAENRALFFLSSYFELYTYFCLFFPCDFFFFFKEHSTGWRMVMWKSTTPFPTTTTWPPQTPNLPHKPPAWTTPSSSGSSWCTAKGGDRARLPMPGSPVRWTRRRLRKTERWRRRGRGRGKEWRVCLECLTASNLR